MSLAETLGQCSRCGFCLPVCPTYGDTGVETQSPRGRVALIRAALSGGLTPGPNLRRHLYDCLYCRACEPACPSGVPVGQAVATARSWWPLPPPRMVGFALRHLLPQPARLERLLPLLRAARWLRLPLTEMLPDLSRPSARRHIAPVTLPQGQAHRRVGYFLGCFMNVAYPRASLATVALLARSGCEVVTPRGVVCCGAPHQAEGDLGTARQLARRNIRLFEDAGLEAIVTECAACSAQLKEYGSLLAGDPEYAGRARDFSRRVHDLSQFLFYSFYSGDRSPELLRASETGRESGPDTLGLGVGLPRPPGEPLRVTYHDPCHLAHAQGVTQPPRHLLQSVPGLELVEMEAADACCGSAGSYVLSHRQRSLDMLERKMAHVAATGAQVVATANPGCLMQLGLGVKRWKLPVRVLHWVEIVAQG